MGFPHVGAGAATTGIHPSKFDVASRVHLPPDSLSFLPFTKRTHPKMVTTRASTRSSPATPAPTARSPAGNALEIDPVSKARTITHMNKDHAQDMSAILRHFAGLTEHDAARAEMLDLDLATMTLRSGSGVHAVDVTPPMASWSDRRGRLVDMTIEARTALGLDVVEEPGHVPGAAAAAERGPVRFYPPAGAGLVSSTGVLWYFVSAAFYFSGHMEPGSAFWQALEAVHFPGGPRTYVWLLKAILVPVVACHLFEALYVMAHNRLAPRGVRVGSMMWLLWVGCTFLEGLPAWQRFDQKVLGKQKGQ